MHTLKLIIALICLILINQNSYSQNSQKKLPKIAVLEFSVLGNFKSESEALTDFFRGEVVKTNKFIVVGREESDKILDELNFQRQGFTPTEHTKKNW